MLLVRGQLRRQRLCKAADRGEWSFELVRDVGDKVAAHRFETARARQIEQRENSASAFLTEGARGERERARADVGFDAIHYASTQCFRERVVQDAVPRQQVDREWHGRVRVEELASTAIDTNDLTMPIHGERALVERLDEGAEQLILGLERPHATFQLFCHTLHSRRELANLARRRNGRTARQVTGRDGARDVTQLGHGLGYLPRKDDGEADRNDESDEAGKQHVSPGARDDLVELRGTD